MFIIILLTLFTQRLCSHGRHIFMYSHFYILICKVWLKVNLHGEIQIEIQIGEKIKISFRNVSDNTYKELCNFILAMLSLLQLGIMGKKIFSKYVPLP